MNNLNIHKNTEKEHYNLQPHTLENPGITRLKKIHKEILYDKTSLQHLHYVKY